MKDEKEELRIARLEMFRHLWFLQENQLETEQHTYKGSVIRHCAIERLLYYWKWKMEKLLGERFDRMWRGMLYAPFIFAFGLNCNYSVKAICGYVLWWTYYRAEPIHWMNFKIYKNEETREVIFSQGEKKGTIAVSKDKIYVEPPEFKHKRVCIIQFNGFGMVAIPKGWSEKEVVECVEYVQANEEELLEWMER